MNSRRDLLKYFAAGTLIAPSAGAAPLARLIEEPRVELVTDPEIVIPIDLGKVKRFSLSFEMADGSQRSWSSSQISPYYAQGLVEPDSAASIRFGKQILSSPAHQIYAGIIAAHPGATRGRCPYCRSLINGDRCSSCGAAA